MSWKLHYASELRLLSFQLGIAGEYPWTDGGSGLAEQRHFGRRYRTLRAQLHRTQEELQILAVEATRTLCWLEEREAAVDNRLGQLAAGGLADVSELAATGRESALCLQGASGAAAALIAAGKAALLRRYHKRLNIIHASARALGPAHTQSS